MTMLRLDPFRGMERFGRRFNELVSDFEKGVSFEMGGFTPRVDITEDEKTLFFNVEIPGMSKEDVKISVNEDRMMTFKGKKSKPEANSEKNYVRHERVYGEFERSFMLPENVDVENISAKYNNGVLELTINKVEPPQPKEINVEIK